MSLQETCRIAVGAGFMGDHLSDGTLAAGHRTVDIENLSTGPTGCIAECYPVTSLGQTIDSVTKIHASRCG